MSETETNSTIGWTASALDGVFEVLRLAHMRMNAVNDDRQGFRIAGDHVRKFSPIHRRPRSESLFAR